MALVRASVETVIVALVVPEIRAWFGSCAPRC